MVTRPVLERHVEAYLLTRVKQLGGTTIKMATIHQRSLPDRLVVLPGGKVGFAELKRPGGKATAAQIHIITKLQRLGCFAQVVVGKEGVDEFLTALQA